MTAEEKMVFESLLKMHASDKAVVKTFSERMLKEPTMALEWADSIFASVARISVIEAVVASIQRGSAMKNVAAQAAENTMRNARNFPSSTSQSHNLLHGYTTAAWAIVSEMLSDF